eukprot:jgi/Bigna1/85262/estExt_fgenesh1_pg.C_30088
MPTTPLPIPFLLLLLATWPCLSHSATPKVYSGNKWKLSKISGLRSPTFRHLQRHKTAQSNERLQSKVQAKMITQSSYEEWVEEEKARGLEQYNKLKKKLIVDTGIFGVLIPVYFFFNGVALIDVLTAFGGSAASLLYMLALFRDVDKVKGTDPTPMLEIKDATGPLSWPVRILAGYAYAFRPRLAIPILLAVTLVILDSRGITIPLSARGTAAASFLANHVALYGV